MTPMTPMAPMSPMVAARPAAVAALPVIAATPPTSADPQLSALAAEFKVRPPQGGTWLDQCKDVCDQLTHAVVLADVTVPGMKLVYANAASERLVGYRTTEQVGRNCRFVQGPLTEAASVRAMVKAIRTSKQTTLRITNYRQDGTAFTNVLTLHPVHDSTGEYRYSMGIQSNAADQGSEGAKLEVLRRMLPTTFDAAMQPRERNYNELTKVDTEAQKKQWRSSLAKFTRLVWSLDWERALKTLVSQPQQVALFGRWLSTEAPSDAMQLELVVLASELQKRPPQ